MAATDAALRREEIDRTDRPLRAFPARRSGGLEVVVYADRVEIRSPRRVIALEYRSIVRCLAWHESGHDALAIVDRAGQVLLIPMRRSEADPAATLINPLLG
jgi:hypothetical protein